LDGLKVGEIKSPHAGHKSGLTDEKLKDKKGKNRQKDIELDRTKRRRVHKNERIKESQ
jgi:hypothetical protein